jgi:hypothetical protein
MKTPTIKYVDGIRQYFVEAPLVDKYGSITAARTDKDTAQALLLENEAITKGGHIYYFALKGSIDTYIVESFEKHLINEGPEGGLPTARY